MPAPLYAIVEAPSVLGLRPTGVERLPEALLAAGLAEGLGAGRAGRVEPPAYDGRRDPATGMLNPGAVAAYAAALADAVGPVLDRGGFPVVLGGDCSIMLGGLLALRRRPGRFGLLFLDGHDDFYLPEEEARGEAASMDLALATGRGPAVAADLEGRGPLVRDEDVAALGARDATRDPDYASRPLPPAMLAIGLDRLRELGAAAAAREAVARLTRDGLDGFWVHLDADVLDDAVMPAVDYRMPDGLAWDELATVLRLAVASGAAVGIEVTIFNPALDPDGRIAGEFARTLVRGLRR